MDSALIVMIFVVFVWAFVFFGFSICPQGMYDYYREKAKPRTLKALGYGLGVLIIWPYFWWKWKRETK